MRKNTNKTTQSNPKTPKTATQAKQDLQRLQATQKRYESERQTAQESGDERKAQAYEKMIATNAKRIEKALDEYRQAVQRESATGILQAERERAKADYLKRLESMDENERLQEMENALKDLPVNDTETITDETAQTMGERIAIRALKTTYQASGNPFILRLYCGLIVDILHNTKSATDNITDGYDIAQNAVLFLLSYRGQKLTDNANNGETDKDGNPVNILRACFRIVGRYIDGERQKEYKRAYLEDADGVFYEIPFKWDLPTIADYKAVARVIEKLKLSQMEKRIFSMRMQGKSRDEIATALNIARGNVNTYCQRIAKKAQAVYGVDEKTLETANNARARETAKRKAETAKRNANPTATKTADFESKTHAQKIATLKRLYRQAIKDGNQEKADKIKRFAVRLEKQHRQETATGEKQAEIEKRLARLMRQVNAPHPVKA